MIPDMGQRPAMPPRRDNVLLAPGFRPVVPRGFDDLSVVATLGASTSNWDVGNPLILSQRLNLDVTLGCIYNY